MRWELGSNLISASLGLCGWMLSFPLLGWEKCSKIWKGSNISPFSLGAGSSCPKKRYPSLEKISCLLFLSSNLKFINNWSVAWSSPVQSKICLALWKLQKGRPVENLHSNQDTYISRERKILPLSDREISVCKHTHTMLPRRLNLNRKILKKI